MITKTKLNCHYVFLSASRVILVQQPFMERRVLATFLHQWPEQGQQTHAIVTSPQMGLSEYPHPTVGTASDLITYMLGSATPSSLLYRT